MSCYKLLYLNNEKRFNEQQIFIRAYKEGLSDTACIVATYL